MSGEKQEFRHLFSTYKIGKLNLKNRMVFQPHVPYFATVDGYPSEMTKNYYIERAKGGIGLIVMESMIVHPSGFYAPGCIELYKEGIVEAFGDFTDHIHSYGACIIGQLSHCGGDTVSRPYQLASAPSAIPDLGCSVVPMELEKETIHEIVKGFGRGALQLKEAGFDGVELKFAHDGLLRAFALPSLNHREDEYGGNYENRLRFFHEIMEEIRLVCGSEYPVGVRLCLDQFVDDGITEEYGIQLARTCEEAGAAYINGDSGSGGDGSNQIFPMCMPLGAGVYLASACKKAVTIPVVAFGRINDPVLMEMILEEGHADLVGSARQFICDPETPNKALEGRVDDIRHCIACNEACIYQCMQAKPIHCAQNPACGREAELGIGTLEKAEKRKKAVVVGAGIAGLKAAEILSKRGHQVTLYEKTDTIGGQMNLADRLPFRAEISEASRYIRIQLQQLGVPVITETEITAESEELKAPDLVIVATGSRPSKAAMEGSENSGIHFMNVWDVILHPETIGENVLVIDRCTHIQGPAVAEYILATGSRVTYYTPQDRMGPDVDPLTMTQMKRRLYAYPRFEDHYHFDGIRVLDNSVVLSQTYSGREFTEKQVDTVILVEHQISENRLYKELKKRRKGVYAVGDCNAPRLIEQVILEAELLARKL